MPARIWWRQPRCDQAVTLVLGAALIITLIGAAALAASPGLPSQPQPPAPHPAKPNPVGPAVPSLLGPGDGGPDGSSNRPLIGGPRHLTPRRQPLVIAHRGASAYRAENTLGAFQLAIDMGADYVEGDVVVTRDGALVVRHDPELSATTDVEQHPEYAARRTTKRVYGATLTGWFVEDFTLAEIKTLRATPRAQLTPPTGSHPQIGGPAETVPSVTELIGLARTAGAARDRAVGVYLELKVPGYYRSIGLAPEPLLAAVLRAENLTGADHPVIVESFEPSSLRLLHQTVGVRLVQLVMGDPELAKAQTTPEALRTIAGYAGGIGLPTSRLAGTAAPAGSATLDRSLIDQTHRAGLEVHVYGFDDSGTRAATLAAYTLYFSAGVDGVFTDKPDIARSVRTG